MRTTCGYYACEFVCMFVGPKELTDVDFEVCKYKLLHSVIMFIGDMYMNTFNNDLCM